MPLRSMRSGSASPQTFTPQLTLVARNGRLAPQGAAGAADPLALAEQRRRSRQVAVLCFGIGLLVLLAAATQLLAAT